ncbi:GATA zinc finger domain-containing protein 14 [Bicyclus anynana]|uniref:GATA zinc finger domain-containing protein 14 n=1 Tax=Bicyclus anynana TaxID=110368 RepID=A0ABM3LQK2_BICAN|nr:GATA zinc finger domain-containing protein 14 [Bicyclus anynana]
MGLLMHCSLLLFLIIECYTLTCRSEHGPKNDELSKIFNNCLKQMQGTGSEYRQSSENDWRINSENQRNPWETDNRNQNKDERRDNRDNKRDKDRNKSYRGNNNGRNDEAQNDRNENKGTDGRYNTNNHRMSNMNGMGVGNNGGRNDMTNSYSTTGILRGQDEFLQSEEYSDASHDNYYTSFKPPRRYKREKRIEINSGQRSQYNPHSQRSNGYDEKNNDNEKEGKSSSENNSSKEVDKACVLQCFMENLHVTDDRGLPDRYLVTHALTKDEKNEDLRDFLQESIEECFQILDNENTESKCEFSKNLLTCLSEKGRTNCDDWNGKPSFLFKL